MIVLTQDTNNALGQHVRWPFLKMRYTLGSWLLVMTTVHRLLFLGPWTQKQMTIFSRSFFKKFNTKAKSKYTLSIDTSTL